MKIALHQSLLAAAFGFCLLSDASAQNSAYQHSIEADRLGELHYVDVTPKYKKVKDAFVIDRVEYTAQHTIVHFRFECLRNEYSGATFYAPGHTEAWVLKAGASVFPLRELRELRINGELQAERLGSTQSYWTDWTTERTTYTCALYFDRLPATLRQADLIEGIGYEKATERFNALNVKLHTWEVIETKSGEEPQPAQSIVEEVMDGRNSGGGGNNSASARLAEITWTAYPNPADQYVHIELLADQPATIAIYNLEGRQLQQMQTQDRITTVTLSDYAAGTYLVRVTIGEHVSTRQVVKK